MRHHQPQDLTTWFEKPQLKHIAQQTKLIRELDQVLARLLPRTLTEACKVANFVQGHLTIEVRSAALAMKVNYMRSTLMTEMRHSGYAGLTGMSVKINPSLYPKVDTVAPAATAPRRLSDKSAACLLTLAETAPKKLKQQLEALAKLATPSEPG